MQHGIVTRSQINDLGNRKRIYYPLVGASIWPI